MSAHKAGPILDQFTEELGEPIAPDRIRQASNRVLDSLSALYEDGVIRHKFPGQQFLPVPKQTSKFVQLLPVISVAALLLAAAVWVGTLSRPDVATVLARTMTGDSIRAGQLVRTAGMKSVLMLRDGSRVELGQDVELSIHRAADGLRVDLNRGKVIVTAAKQHNGHLYVQTRDCLVSVVGTVFSVKAEESGSRVAVLEGKVHVEHGNVSQTLLPGEQVATNPAMSSDPLQKEIEWSADAVAHLTMLRQSNVQPSVAPAPPNPGEDGTIKNKTFFFKLWDQQQANGNLGVLTDAARAGVFRYFTYGSTRSGAALIVQPMVIDAEMLSRYIPIAGPGAAADLFSPIVFTGIRGRTVSFENARADSWSYGCVDCTFAVTESGVTGNSESNTEGMNFKLNDDGSILTATCRSSQCNITTVRPTGQSGWQQPSEIHWDIRNLTRGSEVNLPVGEMLPLPVDLSTGPAANKQAFIFSYAK